MTDPHDYEEGYEDGLQKGRLNAIENMLSRHGDRLDTHEKRLSAQERITYALLGAIALIEILPTIQALTNGG